MKREDIDVDAEQVGTSVIHSHDFGRHALRPTPSLDPNDPLNWATYQKYLTYLCICFFTFLGTVNASKFTVSASHLSREFNVNTLEVGNQICLNVLLVGCVGNIFWVSLMRVIGMRPIYLLSLPLLVAMNVWASKTHNWNYLLVSSIMSGFASSAAEATVPAVVADLFFVQQRGTVLMIFHFALSSGLFLGPLINAFLVEYTSWRVCCEWIAIAAGALWVATVFAVHETSYHLRDIYAPLNYFPARKNFEQKLGILGGYNRDMNILKAVVNTIAAVSYPSVLWAGFTVGIFIGWNIIIKHTASQVFGQDPFNWKIDNLNLLPLSGFIGSTLSLFIGGKLIDMISNRITAARNRRREPEYRLYGIIIPTIVGPMGILLFGLTLVKQKPWIAPVIGYAMQAFGLTAGSNVVVTYVVDSYLELAGEVSVIIFILRDAIGTILVFYGSDWIKAVGMEDTFLQMVGIQYFLCLLVLVFLVWGKKIRAITASYGPMAWGGHRY